MSGNLETTNESFTSTLSTRRGQNRRNLQQSRRDNAATVSAPDVVKQTISASPIGELYDSPDFKIAWSNDLKYHISRHLLRLRKFRGWSQEKVAKLAGTSQPYLARLEAGDENFTAETAERVINALEGRLDVSVAPREMHMPRWEPWWKLAQVGIVSTTPYTFLGAVYGAAGPKCGVAAAWTAATITFVGNNVLGLGAGASIEVLESHATSETGEKASR